MNRIVRWCLVVGLFLVGAAGIGYAHPEWTADLSADFSELSRWNQQLEACCRQAADLESQREATLRRIELKTDVAEDLIAGRLTLRQAATRFKELNADLPQFPSQSRLQYPDGSDDERHCRNLIDY